MGCSVRLGAVSCLGVQSILAAKAARKFKKKKCYGSCDTVSGLLPSLAFTPAQGIALTNPQGHGNALGGGAQSACFSDVVSFSKIKKKT